MAERRAQPIVGGDGRRWSAAVWAWLVLLGTPAVALSQPLESQGRGADASEEAVRAKERWKALIQRGLGEYQRGRFDEALEAFQEAWAIERRPELAASLAEVEMKLGLFSDAAAHWQDYLRHRPPDWEEAATRLAECRRHVASLRIVVEPHPGAEVRVGGKRVGKAPLDGFVFVAPGVHWIEAELGAETSGRKVQVVAGQEYTVTLELALPPPAPVAAVEASATRGHRRGEGESPTDTQRESKSLVPVYAGLGVAAVGLATWIGFGTSAERAKVELLARRVDFGRSGCSEARGVSPECADLNETFERQRAHGKIARVGMGVTLTGVVATLGYVLFWPSPDSGSGSTLAGVRPGVALQADGAAVLASGAF